MHILQHRKHFRVHCQVCQRSYTTNQSMRKHLRTHFEINQCDLCGQTFRHKRLMLNHIAAIHDDSFTVSCNYCTRLFPNKTTRDSHQKIIHFDQQVNTGFFKCPECPVGFEMREELRIHSFIHFEGEIHTCLDCGQIFKLKKLLVNHTKKHETAKYSCKSCNQMFKYRSNLGKHLNKGRCKGNSEVKKDSVKPSPEEEALIAKKQLIAMSVNPEKVAITSDYNLSNQKLIRTKKMENYPTERIAHSTLNITENELINNGDAYKKNSIEHQDQRQKIRSLKIKSVSGFNYECDLCDFVSSKKCKMLSHIRHHIASNRHKCKTCSETFATKMRLQSHSMKVHGRGVIGSVEYSKAAASECNVCNRIFSEERLKFHMKLHEIPGLTCNKCSKVFRNPSALEKHLLSSHATEKKFTCATCGKCFSKMTILKHHEEIHNPFKIYVQCEICNTMMQVKSLKLHMAVKHSDRYKDRNHVCDCGKAFRYEKQLDKHYKAVHEKVNRGIVYPCSDCAMVFNRRSELRLHSFDHYAGKLFECDCGMKFKKKKLLTIHSAVHKESQWPCDLCTLVFKTRGGRRKHQTKVHGREDLELIEIPSLKLEKDD